MSNVVSGLIKLFFGTKSEKDRKLIQPYVDKIKAIYPSIEQLTNDELRARSLALRNSVAEYISGEEKQIEELKAQLEDLDTSLNDKESISRRIDDLTEEIDRKIEEKLEEILPEAFAIVKDTARRFKENEEIVVTATDFDRQLAATKDFVRIEDDKAIYKNSWVAGEIPSNGTWSTTTASSSAVSCSTKGTSRRWRPVRVKRWSLPSPYSSMHWPEREFMW